MLGLLGDQQPQGFLLLLQRREKEMVASLVGDLRLILSIENEEDL